MTSKAILPISVVVPTYNRQAIVGRAIDSILGQTNQPAEIIVVDDGSTDDTGAMLAQQYDSKITYIRQENQGVAAARNNGILAATQDTVAFLDSDDRWVPDKLENQFASMQDSRVVLSATNWSWEDAPTKSYFSKIGVQPTAPWRVETDPLTYLCRSGGHGIVVQTCLCRRQPLVDMGGFDRQYRIAEDNDLVFRLAEQGSFALFSDVMMLRCADDGISHLTETRSTTWRAENLDNMLRILEARFAGSPSVPARRAVRRRIGELRVDRGKLHASLGENSAARRLFLQQVASLDASKQTLVAAIGLIAPGIIGKRA